MTKRVGGITFIEQEAPQECELCGTVAETRPYGPGGKRICFECGKKDPETVEKQMRKMFCDVD